MNEKFPVQESTPVAGDSTEHFKAVFSEKNTGESVQDSHQAEFDSGLSAPESKEAGNNQPETGRGRNHNAPRGEDSRNTHNRKRAENYKKGGDHTSDNSEEVARTQSRNLRTSYELTEERGSQSMAQLESKRSELATPDVTHNALESVIRGTEMMADKYKGRLSEDDKKTLEQINTQARQKINSKSLDNASAHEAIQPFLDLVDKFDSTQAPGDGSGQSEASGSEQDIATVSSPEQNNQNAPQAASPEEQGQQSSEQTYAQADISVEDLLQSFDGGKDKTDKPQTIPDGKTVSEQSEPEKEPDQENSEASTNTESLIQELQYRFGDKFEEIFEEYIQKLQEQGMSAEEARAAAPAILASKIGTLTGGQENGESSTGTKSSIDIDIDRVVRQYQHEGMSLEDARAAAVDLAARIEGGSSNSRTAEPSELPNYAANQTNTTFSNEGDMNWYSPATYETAEYNTTGSSNSTHSGEQNESEEKDITTAEKTRRFADNVKRKSLIAFDNFAFRTRREARKYLTPLESVYNLAKSETARRRIATTAIGSLAIFGTYVGNAENFQNSRESKEDKTTNTPEVASGEPDVSEAFLAAGIGGLAEDLSSSIPGKEDIEEHTGVTINETQDGRGYEIKAMAGTSGEELLEEVDNFANRIAEERLKWNIEDISIAEPLLEAAGVDVEKLAGSIDDARTFVIDTEAVRKAALKVAKENPSSVWERVNSLAG